MKVKVRIAVAIDKNGFWSCAGWKVNGHTDPEDFLGLAVESLDSPDAQKTVWIEAEVEPPTGEVETIQGQVKP